MVFKSLNNIEELNEGDFIIYKHSMLCPIAQKANVEVEKFLENNSKVDIFKVVVQNDRPLSNKIAEELKIKHETPQLIVKKSGKLSSISHFDITQTEIKNLVGVN